MRIPPDVSEWVNLAARWFHVFAGIMWIGTTYYFTWLDARLGEEERAAAQAGERAQVWMVHSGGFYVVEKRKEPSTRELHWFRWEAGLTWLSGAALLVWVYYLGGALVDPDVGDDFVRAIGRLPGGRARAPFLTEHYLGFAVVFCVALLVVGWLVYDLLVRSPLGKNEWAFAAVGYLLLVAVSYLLARVLSGRAAYIHVGALMGTIMAANVWLRILPAQSKMIAATKAGRAPDYKLAASAKLRSKQNTFMVVPVVFTMISNHFAGTYGSRYNWLILSALILVGWLAAKFIRRA
ncbi:MAG TPA: urate hydroxylase PuuD [Pyrinomonadaceae bacterium]|jgi:uncharacterized membrane protein